jgi:hypothetical protein
LAESIFRVPVNAWQDVLRGFAAATTTSLETVKGSRLMGCSFPAPFAILFPPEENLIGVHRVFLAQLRYGGVSFETFFGDPLL